MSNHPLYGNVKDYLNCIESAADDYMELLYILKEVCLDWDEGYLTTGQAHGLIKRIIKEMR